MGLLRPGLLRIGHVLGELGRRPGRVAPKCRAGSRLCHGPEMQVRYVANAGPDSSSLRLYFIPQQHRSGRNLVQLSLEVPRGSVDYGRQFLVEGQELPKGKADVVVTDGFTGNVVIKLSEGLGGVFAEISKQAVDNNPHFREAEKRILNYTALGGALLLGVAGNVIITHGKSDASAIKQAIRLAAQMVREGVAEAIGT